MKALRYLLPGAALLVLIGFLVYDGHEPTIDAPAGRGTPAAPTGGPGLSARQPTAQREMAGVPEPLPKQAVVASETPEARAERKEFVIRGRVLSAAGDPIAGVQVRCDGAGWEFTDADGRFTQQVRSAGMHTLEAIIGGLFNARAKTDVRVTASGDSPDVELRFPAEGSLRGRALYPDGRPAEGVLLKMTTKSNRMGLSRFAEGIWSFASARSWLACRVDAQGWFGFAGLDARSEYALWSMGDDGKLRCHSEGVRGGRMDMSLEISRHRLRVSVVDAATQLPLEAAMHSSDPITAARMMGQERDESLNDESLNYGSDWDEPDHVAPAGTSVRVVVFRSGYEIHDAPYVMGDAYGEQTLRVALKPVADPPLLRVAVRGPEGPLLESVPLEFFYVSSRGEPEVPLHPVLTDVRGIQQTRAFAAMRLRVTTGDLLETPAWSAFGNMHPASTTIDVPDAGETWARLDLTRGGSVRLLFKDPPVRGVYSGYYFLDGRLRNADGAPVPVRWYRPTKSAWHGWSGLATDGPRTSSVLPAGKYQLTLAQSFRSYELKTITVPIVIEDGKTVDVPVQLVREPMKR